MISLNNILNRPKTIPTSSNTEKVEEILISESEGEDKYVASAAYLYFVSAAILTLRKNNSEFVTFHARQAFVLLLLAIVAFVFLAGIWRIIFSIGVLAINIYGAYQALNGRKWNIPYLTQIANSIDI